MKKDEWSLLVVSCIAVIIGAVIFVAYTTKLNIENQNTMWATGGLALTALGAGFLIYLFGKGK